MSKREPTEPQQTQAKWTKTAATERNTPKFLKAGAIVVVEPAFVPKETMVEGRFGKRKMYIINTKEQGLIYITPQQLIKVVENFAEDFSSALTVTL